ncbi:MAG: TRAP-type C4-dicarboxylate transport system, substrate-binding protein [Ramlibacter sp.]|nr:TRAP-type C4-dicarboxylate transport system, substrate-binding protein [Ramlibacter sp.]
MKALERIWRPLAGALVAAGAALASNAWAQTPVEWRFFTYFPVNDKPSQTSRAFAEDVLKATGGKLKITVMAAGELPYKAPDVLRAVATNQVQMGDVAVGFLAGDVPALNVMQLPFLCSSYAQFEQAMPPIARVIDSELQAKYGVTVGVHWTMPPQNLWLNRPVARLADLKQVKVRAWNPEQVEMMKLLGGSAVSITSAEVIPALERKVIDGAITSALSANDWKAYEIVRTGYMLNITMGHQVMLVNSAELAKLAPEVRTTLLAKMKEYSARYRKMSEDGDNEARKSLVANKVKLVEASSDDVKQARAMLKPMWASWAKANGPTGQQLLDIAAKACGAL